MDPEENENTYYTGPDGEQYDNYGDARDAWEKEEEYTEDEEDDDIDAKDYSLQVAQQRAANNDWPIYDNLSEQSASNSRRDDLDRMEGMDLDEFA